MLKVSFCDKKIRTLFFKYASATTASIAAAALFWDIPKEYKHYSGLACIAVLVMIYLMLWYKANKLTAINLSVEGSTVTIKTGDIFAEQGLKAIAFNEYFDTKVDNIVIAHQSLNGQFVTDQLTCSVQQLDTYIDEYSYEEEDFAEINLTRLSGKNQRYKIGTICVWNEYLLTAFSKFNKYNEAHLSMPEYLEFLINFWNKVNRVYAQQSVTVPIFGSGITRIKGHKLISDEELLKIMLWTFRVSEMRFTHPAKLTIIIHKDKISKVNLFELQMARSGL
ncbi:macro domain-containing protein [Pantoea sp. USHLN256]|uniref:macro domain-containing protein n=1 Tax=Pantoea sp. USHLN256 TaxID=3081293 RepID=UPI00301A715E